FASVFGGRYRRRLLVSGRDGRYQRQSGVNGAQPAAYSAAGWWSSRLQPVTQSAGVAILSDRAVWPDDRAGIAGDRCVVDLDAALYGGGVSDRNVVLVMANIPVNSSVRLT